MQQKKGSEKNWLYSQFQAEVQVPCLLFLTVETGASFSILLNLFSHLQNRYKKYQVQKVFGELSEVL